MTRRSKEEFYHDMIKFKELKEKKLNQQRQAQDEQEVEECRKSKSISWEVTSEIYERLYCQNIKNVKKPENLLTKTNQWGATDNEGSRERSASFTRHKSPRLNAEEITKKLYEDAQRRTVNDKERKSSSTRKDIRLKTSERSNNVYAGRILK